MFLPILVALAIGPAASADEASFCHETKTAWKEWIREDLNQNISIGLPDSFKQDPKKQPMHGGRTWRSGSKSFVLMRGYWEKPDDARITAGKNSERCSAIVGGQEILFFRKREGGIFRTSAWFGPSPSGFPMTWMAWGESTSHKDEGLFVAIIHSIQFSEAKK